MKEYKVLTAEDPEQAEKLMNETARQGWRVKAVTHWETAMAHRPVIAFERDA